MLPHQDTELLMKNTPYRPVKLGGSYMLLWCQINGELHRTDGFEVVPLEDGTTRFCKSEARSPKSEVRRS